MSRTLPHAPIKGRKPGRKLRRRHHHQERRQSRHEIMWEYLMADHTRFLDEVQS